MVEVCVPSCRLPLASTDRNGSLSSITGAFHRVDHLTFRQAAPSHMLVVPLLPEAGRCLNPLRCTIKGSLEAHLMFPQPVIDGTPVRFLDSAKEEINRELGFLTKH
ncbi:hypothetical protein AAFF_G00185580 [Aldrovandia affinis]|uniref:Uncharacterized protein n=1 Tax=Aldrovandia affinis TaxID=143900 RepID=A0AAD7RKF1_9TELE|nr:hypothetical protein AAFF_G00185580 [Aldrovandia affinis]